MTFYTAIINPFSNTSTYGIEYINIDEMYAGIGQGADRISLSEFELDGWGNKVTYHERLKSSYYIMKNLWNGDEVK